MKKLSALLLVFLIACSSTTEVESSETPKISTTISTTSETTTTIEEGDTPFNVYWRDNKLVSYPPLTEEEVEISKKAANIDYLIPKKKPW